MIPRLSERPEISVSENRYNIRGLLEGIPSLPYVINNLRGSNASITADTKPLGLLYLGFLLVDKRDDVARLDAIASGIRNSMKERDELFSAHETEIRQESKKILNKAYRAWNGVSEKDHITRETGFIS